MQLRSDWRAVTLLVLTGLALVRPEVGARTSTTCPAADPFDGVGDSAALNTCLANYDEVLLEPSDQGGYVGYIIDWVDTGSTFPWFGGNGQGRGITLKTNNTIAPSGSGAKPLLIADPDLEAPMVTTLTSSPSNYELHNLAIDGDKHNRSSIPNPCPSNIGFLGSGWVVVDTDVRNAVCGSGFVAEGSGYLITGNTIYNNGWDTGPVSDGLTIASCSNSTITYNSIMNNTDINLVMFYNSSGCVVRFNHIDMYLQYAFGGIQILENPGGEVSNNLIESDEDLLSGGLILGVHGWTPNDAGGDVGEVSENEIYGAVINLMIDGIDDGDVYDNIMSGAQGSTGLGDPACSTSANYTAAHFGSATIQGGYTSLVVHPDGCYTPAPSPTAVLASATRGLWTMGSVHSVLRALVPAAGSAVFRRTAGIR